MFNVNSTFISLLYSSKNIFESWHFSWNIQTFNHEITRTRQMSSSSYFFIDFIIIKRMLCVCYVIPVPVISIAITIKYRKTRRGCLFLLFCFYYSTSLLVLVDIIFKVAFRIRTLRFCSLEEFRMINTIDRSRFWISFLMSLIVVLIIRISSWDKTFRTLLLVRLRSQEASRFLRILSACFQFSSTSRP